MISTITFYIMNWLPLVYRKKVVKMFLKRKLQR